tara:strand:+ start:1557 stop:1895 length:339 start_codon:yes stop_codon:yes gene_type:complete
MINLMNYYEHPGDNRYYVFEYRSIEKSMNFEALLEKYVIEYEKLLEPETEDTIWMCKYAISKSRFKDALRAHNLTESKYRNPMIGNKYVRYGFVIFMISLVSLAFIGYLKSK